MDVVYSTPMTRNGSGLSGPVLPKCPPPQGSIIPKPAEPVHTNAVIMPWYALRVIDPTTKDWSTLARQAVRSAHRPAPCKSLALLMTTKSASS